MVKQRCKKNETPEAGPEASDMPDSEIPEHTVLITRDLNKETHHNLSSHSWGNITEKNFEYKGLKIHIFSDFPPFVVKWRAAFTKVRELLRGRPGVRYGLVYPARLMVTHGNVKVSFTDPKDSHCRLKGHNGRDTLFWLNIR